jgi:hypothetical protein
MPGYASVDGLATGWCRGRPCPQLTVCGTLLTLPKGTRHLKEDAGPVRPWQVVAAELEKERISPRLMA